jgi:hypothetical protein
LSDRRKIVIVGNGEISERAAGEIDAADLVVRFNDCRSTKAGGTKTDIVAVCNTGRPAAWMLSAPEWRGNPAVLAASAIWCVRDPEKFADMKAPLAISHPELDDFCDDYTGEFAAFAAETGKGFAIIDRSTHEATDDALAAFDPDAYVVPSSGLIVIAEMLRRYPNDDLGIAGFGHVGWDGHPFAAEKRLVDAYVASGRLRRII